MTRFKVPIQSILGLSYYRYDISLDRYDVDIGSEVTVTCQARNVFGSLVKDKELTLHYKGISQGSATTDNNGVAEWTLDVGGDAGTFKLSVGNQHCLINVTGYQTYNGTHYTAKYNKDIVNIDFSWNTTSTFSANTSWTEFTTITIPSHLRPTESIIVNTHYNGLQINIQPNGVCRWANRSNTSITNPQIHFTVTYRKGDS